MAGQPQRFLCAGSQPALSISAAGLLPGARPGDFETGLRGARQPSASFADDCGCTGAEWRQAGNDDREGVYVSCRIGRNATPAGGGGSRRGCRAGRRSGDRRRGHLGWLGGRDLRLVEELAVVRHLVGESDAQAKLARQPRGRAPAGQLPALRQPRLGWLAFCRVGGGLLRLSRSGPRRGAPGSAPPGLAARPPGGTPVCGERSASPGHGPASHGRTSRAPATGRPSRHRDGLASHAQPQTGPSQP
jgi:hypothetical protein